MNYVIVNPFPCNIFEEHLKLDGDFLEKITAKIKQESDTLADKELVSSHFLKPSIHDWDDNFKLLTKILLKSANTYYREIKQLPFEPNIFLIQRMWFNVYRPFASMRIHEHSESPYVGTLYLTDSTAPICFTHPSAFKLNTIHRITPKRGKLIIWPGWLMHEVWTSNEAQERISISFKLNFTAPHYGLDGRAFNTEPLDNYNQS